MKFGGLNRINIEILNKYIKRIKLNEYSDIEYCYIWLVILASFADVVCVENGTDTNNVCKGG